MGFCVDLFLTRQDVREAYKRGMLSAGVSLRHYQFMQAKSGNTTMLIWLGKQYLGQRDEPDGADDTGPVIVNSFTPKKVEEHEAEPADT